MPQRFAVDELGYLGILDTGDCQQDQQRGGIERLPRLIAYHLARPALPAYCMD
jgi:hypothetical protein